MNLSDVHTFIMAVALVYGEDCNPKSRTRAPINKDILKETSQSPKPRKRCCPYDFDSSLCKVIDDRILCGFNRNLGKPESNGQYKPLAGGCRLRGGRVECGYFEEPYEGIRRPPPNWEEPSQDYPNEPVTQTDKPAEEVIEYHSQEKLKYTVTPFYPGITKCVEIHSRVVCRQT